MKKYIIFIALSLLCFFLKIYKTNAQNSALKIGDKIPDVIIKNIFNYKTTTAKLSDFKGKLLILDFWATWCAPCVGLIPKMDSLQKVFENKVQFFPVTYQGEKEVLPFLERLEKNTGMKLMTSIGDKELSRFFPHKALPHYVWIDVNAKVIAITGYEAVTSDNIRAILTGKIALTEKKDPTVHYDNTKPLMTGSNGIVGKVVLFHSVLTGYVEGLAGGLTIRTDSVQGTRLSVRNLPLSMLYWIAHEDQGIFNKSNTILEVRDPSRLMSNASGTSYDYWKSQNNGFTYELIVPLHEKKNIYRFMREDMQRYFPQYKATLEMKPTRAYVLVRISNVDKLRTSGGEKKIIIDHLGAQLRNCTITVFMNALRTLYMQNSHLPLLDETGYKGRIDLDIQTNLSDMKKLNQELKKYDLEFIEAQREVKLLIIRDEIK